MISQAGSYHVNGENDGGNGDEQEIRVHLHLDSLLLSVVHVFSVYQFSPLTFQPCQNSAQSPSLETPRMHQEVISDRPTISRMYQIRQYVHPTKTNK